MNTTQTDPLRFPPTNPRIWAWKLVTMVGLLVLVIGASLIMFFGEDTAGLVVSVIGLALTAVYLVAPGK